MTIKDFAKQEFLQLQLWPIKFRTDLVATEWDKEAKHFQFEIRCYQGDNFGKSIRGNYSQGSAIKGKPTIEDILNSLIMDTINIPSSFEDWASEFGYDTDSRKAEQIYNACLKEDKDLKYILGNKHSQLMECETL